MEKVFQTVLLLALPASGKSEVRHFLSEQTKAHLAETYHIGDILQLDDFPYVYLMRRIDVELERLGEERIFFRGDEKPFRDDRDWGTLTHLLNEDYHDLKNSVRVSPRSEAAYLFTRIDRASVLSGLPARISAKPQEIREKIARALEEEARKVRTDKEAQYTEDLADRTILIECARGGPDGAKMPLKGAFGYQYTLAQFDAQVLSGAAVLYIQVTPAESRRKNSERFHPEDPSSNLFHGTPMEVMLGEYGCDDMTYLLDKSERRDTLTVRKDGQVFYLPTGVFDNREDKTSFLRADKSAWEEAKVAEVAGALQEATDTMWSLYGDNAVEHFKDVEVVSAGDEEMP